MERLVLPIKPIPIKDRVSVLFVEKGRLVVIDGALFLSIKMASGRRSGWSDAGAGNAHMSSSSCVPRAGGDEPDNNYAQVLGQACSPHGRG